MVLFSRKSRKKREKPGPMNLSHTDLTNLTDGASLRPRLSALPSALSRMVLRAQAMYAFVRFLCETKNPAMKEIFAFFARFA